MTERIGDFLWKNNFSTFSLSYQRGRLEYFHTILSIIKISIVFAVIFYFEIYNYSGIETLILFVFFAFLIFIFSTQLVGIYIKPTKNIIEYDRSKNLFSIRINHFRTKELKISDIDSIIIDNIKECVSSGGGHSKVYRYMSVVYCKDIDGNKHEMFIVNPSGITQKYEDEIVYELTKISNKICDKISFILDVKVESVKFDINNDN
ncbi:hypothetical protein [Tenacibaculum aiptasiae]|uniref:hypothetical protein n=1 Tax=Tenacibaculum aiptasiae TaxID=426481 RepID=UPI00232B24BD|nr:hypothetical protein [Tenacibaculum aiptasiae]